MAQHWLARTAAQASLPGAADLELKPLTGTAEAWKRVTAACNVTSAHLAQVVADTFRTKLADLSAAAPTSAKLVPASIARKHQVLALRDRERQIVLATADPTNPDAEREIGFASGRMPLFEIAPPEELERAIERAYSDEGAMENILRLVDAGAVQFVADESEQVRMEDTSSPPVVRLANAILFQAIRQGASDIHLQPTVAGGMVRNRVDGVLHTAMQVPLPILIRVISRIKVLAKLNIADHVRPQDGRMRVAVDARNYDLRISTVPTREAEKCVIRILDPQQSRTLDDIGLRPRELELFRKQLKRRDGIVVVTGPTGSGKTTTMYGALREISTEDVNAVTVEDPVEFELAGLTQIPVDPKRGVTFASALRAILRQDPDVIFVGEVRDAETAGIAVQASMTGHLVLATLHTNEALGAIRRLADLGVDIPAIAQTLRASMAQRLVRQLCSDCAEPVTAPLTPQEQRLAQDFGVRPPRRAHGCDECNQTGYRGRLPLTELFVMTPELERLILAGASVADLTAAARAAGMRPLREVGIEVVQAGLTTVEELERVLGETADAETAPGVEPDAPTAASRSTPLTEPETAVPTVLMVDDDSSNRMIGRALLEREGYRVVEARDGREALDLLMGNPDFSLIVLDLDMPRVNGRQVLRVVRDTAATAALPVIVLTGSEEPQAEVELLENGADDYLSKPLEPARFLLRVKAVLRRARG